MLCHHSSPVFSTSGLALVRQIRTVLVTISLMHVTFAFSQATETAVTASSSPRADSESGTARLNFNPTEKPTVDWLPAPVDVPDASARGEEEMKPYTERLAGSGVTFRMVPIAGGRFTMGSPVAEEGRKEDEGPQIEVEVEPFWMGQFEVTWSEFELWAGDAGFASEEDQGTGKTAPTNILADAITRPTKPFQDLSFGMGKEECPAICMTQLAARCYCKWLSAKTGRYYRLPTEAEWEYACRAGTAGAYSFGVASEEPDDHAWYFFNGDDRYHKVGTRKPNPWGLYDMHGNVSEWVLDHYSPDAYRLVAAGKATFPLVLSDKDAPHVVRGGSWDSDPEQLRSAARDYSRPEWKEHDPRNPKSIWYNTEITCPGFRVVRPLNVPTIEESNRYEPSWEKILEYSHRQTADYGK